MLDNNQTYYFVITGRLQSFKREIARQFIEILGSHYQHHISTTTTVLVTGFFSMDLFDLNRLSTKTRLAATNKNILKVNEEQFIQWIINCLNRLNGVEIDHLIDTMSDSLNELFPELKNCLPSEFIPTLISSIEKHYPIV